jgi:hypothetical protein
MFVPSFPLWYKVEERVGLPDPTARTAPATMNGFAYDLIHTFKVAKMKRCALGLLLGAVTWCGGPGLLPVRAQKATDDPTAQQGLEEKQPLLTAGRFESVLRLVKPQDGELRFREIPWLLSVHEARTKAAAEGKPILVWSGSGGAPLGVC